MTTTTETKKSQLNKILTSLDPQSQDFNFELWAREVRQQMLTVLEQRFSSGDRKTSK